MAASLAWSTREGAPCVKDDNSACRFVSAVVTVSLDGFRRLEVITGVGRRRRWTDEEKARIMAESLDPATTPSAVARR